MKHTRSFAVCLASLAGLAVLAALGFGLLATPRPLPLPDAPRALLLSAEAAQAPEDAAASANAQGFNTLALHGEAAETLGRDGVKTLQAAAARQGLALCLLDDTGTDKAAAQLARQRGVPLLTAKTRGEQTAWCDRAGLPVLFSGGGAAQLAAAVQVEQAGLLLADPDSAEAALVLAFLSGGAAPALPGLETENQLTLAYPQEGGVLYESTVTLCGTARAGAEPVTVNGRAALQVGRVWAIAMELAEGENAFTVRQGDEVLTLHCTQRTPQFTPVEPEPDGSAPAERGQWLRTTTALTSLLEDPADPSSIAAGLPAGVCAPVGESRRLTKNGKYTWAYRVDGAGWVLSADCELLGWRAEPSISVAQEESAANGDDFWRLSSSDPDTTPLFLARRTDENSLEIVLIGTSAEPTADNTTEPSKTVAEGTQKPSKNVADGAAVTVSDGFVSVTLPAPAAGLWGWDIQPDGSGGLTVHLKAAPQPEAGGPLAGLHILLDPGHGGTDEGATGCAGQSGPQEKDLNLALALAARTRLTQLGAQVTLTRDGDTALTLNQRREVLAAQAPDLFLSLHHNSAGFDRDSTNVGGVECYYFTARSAPLARALTERLGGGTGRTLRGARQDYYYVTRTDLCPAVLLETGFLTSAAEYAACTDPETIWAEAGLIAQAVAQVYGGAA